MKLFTFSTLLFTFRWVFLVVGSLSVGLFPGHAFAESDTEYRVKAAFLYHFVQFTEWPDQMFPQKESRIRICVYGENSFHGLLKQVFDRKSVKTRRFLVQDRVSTAELKSCHLVFVNRKVEVEMQSVRRVLQRSKGLIVGESENFLKYGGMIQFFLEENKIRFAVNPDALKRNNIRLSSKLLRLAKIIKPE